MFGAPNVERLKLRGDVRKLVKALRYKPDEQVRREAALALGEVGDRQVAAVLVEVMASDVCPVAGAVATSLRSISATGVPVEDLVDALVRSRRWHAEGVRSCSCRWRSDLVMGVTWMVRPRVDAAHLPLFVELLNDDDALLREFAAMVLERMGPPAVIPLLARLAEEQPGSVVHRVVLKAIASFGDPSTVDVLVRGIADIPFTESHRAYRFALDDVVSSGLPGLAEGLAALIPDARHVQQREQLADAVGHRLDAPALVDAAMAQAALADRRAGLDKAIARQHIPTLIGLLDGEFAEEARRALSGIASPEMYDELVYMLRGAHWEFAAAELGRRRERQAVFQIIDQLRAGREGVLPALAQLGVTDVDEFLVSALDSPDLRSRAVIRVDPDRAASALRRIAEDEAVPYHVRYLAQSRVGPPPAGDPYETSVKLLMSAAAELGLGRDLGRTPYTPGTAVDPSLPRPGYVTVSSNEGCLYQEEYTDHSYYDDGTTLRRWQTPGFHWNVRSDDSGSGTYFLLTVRADGQVEFSGGIERHDPGDGPRYPRVRHPADPDGWRATVAAFNHHTFGSDNRIRLSEP
jgi:HEAT repeat protein